MFKIVTLIFLFFAININVYALKVETYDNFTRFIFEPKDIQANVGNIYGSYWYYPGYQPVSDCAATTVLIYLPKKAILSGYLTIKSTSHVWVESPRELPNIKVLNIKTFSQFGGLTQEIQNAPFYLSELKDIKILFYKDNSSYIEAKTENYSFIDSKLMFEKKQDAWGKVNFCIANIIPRTEVYVSSLIIDAIM